MFWSRPLFRAERDFVSQYFGHALDACLPHLRLYLRRVGDTRRALSLPGGRISLPRNCFVHANPQQALHLQHPQVAGLFAHELLHQWQRQQDRAVTVPAAWLQLKALCTGFDPYAYRAQSEAAAMLALFLRANVEQQGQIWQDYVTACVAGQSVLYMRDVAAHVRRTGAVASV